MTRRSLDEQLRPAAETGYPGEGVHLIFVLLPAFAADCQCDRRAGLKNMEIPIKAIK